MKTQFAPRPRYHRTNLCSLMRIAAFVVIVALIGIALSSSSSALSANHALRKSQPLLALRVTSPVQQTIGTFAADSTTLKTAVSQFFTLMPQGPLAESVGTFDATCSTPKTTFAVGEIACAKAEGTLVGSYKVYWVDSQGAAVQTDIVSASSPTATWTVTASGNWKAYLSDSDSLRALAPFQSSDANVPAVDLSVANTALGSSSFVSDGLITYQVWVLNSGPDPATNVSLVHTVPNNVAREAQSQDSGPTFTCTDTATDSTCDIATLGSGVAAYFTFIYKVNNGAPAGSLISNSTTVTSATTELHADDNTATAENTVISGVAATACTLDCPSNITTLANTTFNGNPGAIVNFSPAEGVGSCGEISTSNPSGSFFPVGTTTVVVTSSAGGGGCSFDVIVVTEGAPTISCPADVTTTVAANETSANVNPGTPTTTPATNVSVAGVRSDNEELTAPYPVGTTLITWTVTDSVGLTASCTQRVVVNASACGTDTENPTITAPADVTITTPPNIVGSCGFVVGEGQLGTADAQDNCSVNVSRTGIPAGNFFPVGETIITYTATDPAGNTATDTQKVTIIDGSNPVIEAPPDASYTCMSEVPAAQPSQATRGTVLDENGNPLPPGPPVDNCGAPTVTVTETSTGAGSAASPKIITRTFTATDAAGNSVSDDQVITVIDPTSPTITAPPDATFQCASEVPAANPSSATAADNCGSPTVTVADASNNGAGTAASPLVITRTFTATDAAGNTASDAQVITVIDTTPPVISCPANITVFLPLNSPATSMAVNYPAPTATDNCTSPTVTTNIASGSVFPVGTTPVTATADDGKGNVSTCTFTVTVLYNFTGFFQPVDNLPTLNVVTAGKAVPVKFSLSGDKGLNIFAANSPSTISINCDGSLPQDDVEETLNAGESSLSYDVASDSYIYVWKTQNQWKNTCRQLVVVLNDGSEHRANFKFK